MGRLTAENNTAYTYDDFGNRQSKTENGVITTYQYDKNNRLLSASAQGQGITQKTMYQYDPNGNQISKVTGTQTQQAPSSHGYFLSAGTTIDTALYTYNAHGQMIKAETNGKTASYTYAPDGLRSSKTVDGETICFVYDSGNIIEEFNTNVSNLYYRGLELIKNNNNQYYVYNGHGDVAMLIDSIGEVVTDYTYDAFGNEQTASVDTNPFRYCGEYTDDETGLIYLRARYYDTDTGRFISEDPAKDGLNWYVYCGSNPIVFVDPWGETYLIAWSYGKKDVENYVSYKAQQGVAVSPDTSQWNATTWKDFTDRNAFSRAAQTRKQELLDAEVPESEICLQRIDNKDDLKATWDMWQGYAEIDGLDFFSHGYSGGAEVYKGSGDFWGGASKLNWNSKAQAVFYGCDTGNGSFAQNFANRQNILTYAMAGEANFSYSREKFVRIKENDTSLGVYLVTFDYSISRKIKTDPIPMKRFVPTRRR